MESNLGVIYIGHPVFRVIAVISNLKNPRYVTRITLIIKIWTIRVECTFPSL